MMNDGTREMNLEEFRQLLDAHGADMGRWPAKVRAPAQALLLESEEARALLAEARALDDLLRASAVPEPAEDLLARIEAVADASSAREAPRHADELRGAKEQPGHEPVVMHPAAVRGRHARPAPWWMAVPIAASLLLGVWLGLSGALAPVEEVLLADAGDELELILELAAEPDGEEL